MDIPNASPNLRRPNANCIPPAHVGASVGHHRLALGLPGFVFGLLGFTIGPPGIFDTNMLVSATQKSPIGGIAQREGLTQGSLHCSGI